MCLYELLLAIFSCLVSWPRSSIKLRVREWKFCVDHSITQTVGFWCQKSLINAEGARGRCCEEASDITTLNLISSSMIDTLAWIAIQDNRYCQPEVIVGTGIIFLAVNEHPAKPMLLHCAKKLMKSRVSTCLWKRCSRWAPFRHHITIQVERFFR